LSTKLPALETIFNGGYQLKDLGDVVRDIQEKTGADRKVVNSLIMQHTGFTNFYNVYRNSSQQWIQGNIRPVKLMMADVFTLKSDSHGAEIAAKIERLDSIRSPSGDRVMHQEYLLAPLFFCLDPRLRFPIINGSKDVVALLSEFGVQSGSLVEKFSALVSLLDQKGITDAADIDQIRSGFSEIANPRKKAFKLAVPPTKERDLEQKDDGDYEILRKVSGTKGRRKHNALTNLLLEIYTGVVEVSDTQCKFDALVKDYFEDGDLLIEVKSSIEIAEVRMAIGQLYDYHRQLPKNERITMAVLLPKEPGSNVKGLLEYAEIGLLYFEGKTLREIWW